MPLIAKCDWLTWHGDRFWQPQWLSDFK